MTIDTSALFTPLDIRGKTLRNRIVMPPMVVNRDLAGPAARDWYGRHAAGGVGLVIIEATSVADVGGRFSADDLRPLVDAIHDGGALAAIQLFPGVRGEPTVPADLNLDGIDVLINNYHIAAQVCADAGFDGIQPHGAHGYLLNQFFSPVKNTRTDSYGVSPLNRARLALRIVRTVRPIADAAGMLVLYRHTPVGPGYGIDDSLVLARALIDAGVDVLDISPASDGAPGDRAAPFVPLGVPVIAVNLLDELPRALEVLREERAQLVAVGRGLIADAEWAIKVREGRLDELVTCIRCDGCHADLRRGIEVGCTQWPA
jgi:2,4-dienoyl-CoA reductase-like NADH-dependent reductase (Old Yellow Enzyme family)